MSTFGGTTLNAGSGGPTLATSTDTAGKLMPWSAISFIASGNANDGTAVFQEVDATHGLPVNVVAGSVTLGAGSAVIGHVIVDSGTVAISGTVTVGGTVAISGSVAVTGTFWQATQPISAASLPLPAGAAADGTDITGSAMPTGGAGIRGWLSAVYTWLKTQLAFGQATMAASLPVVIASNQSAVPVSGTFWQATQPVSGTFWQATQPVSIAGTVTVTTSGTTTVSGTVNQGTPNTPANSWPVEITDGTNILGTLTHPVRTDPTGTTVQPVSWSSAQHVIVDSGAVGATVTGTVTANQGGSWSITTVSTVTTVSAVTAITNALPAGTNSLGTVGLNTGNNNAGFFTPAPAGQTVGAIPFCVLNAANTTPIQIKGSAGTLWDLIGMQVGTTAPIYAKFFDKATSPTMGSDTPKYTLPLPTAGNANGAGAARSFTVGLEFTAGIWVSFTTGIALLDNTAGAANQAILSGGYT